MLTNTIEKTYEQQLIEFNQFLSNNRDFILKSTPLNPTLSKDDEWRTDDYSEYDNMEDNKRTQFSNGMCG